MKFFEKVKKVAPHFPFISYDSFVPLLPFLSFNSFIPHFSFLMTNLQPHGQKFLQSIATIFFYTTATFLLFHQQSSLHLPHHGMFYWVYASFLCIPFFYLVYASFLCIPFSLTVLSSFSFESHQPAAIINLQLPSNCHPSLPRM